MFLYSRIIQQQFLRIQQFPQLHFTIKRVQTAVASAADHDGLLQFGTGIVFFKMRASMQLARYQMMRGQNSVTAAQSTQIGGWSTQNFLRQQTDG